MTKQNKCPYCPGDARKIEGRVAGKSSHFSFGYGERTWECTRCGERYSVCYSVPPKGARPDMEKPNEKILKITFSEGVRGFADPLILRAQAPAPLSVSDEPASDSSNEEVVS